jgi:hypothetical protein
MTTARRVGGIPVAASVTILAGLWVSLFLWRKTFSYITVFGVYIIEFAVLAALAGFAFYVLLRPNLSFYIPRDSHVRLALGLTVVFVTFCVARAIFSPRINPIALIPGVYPIYLAMVAVIAANAPDRTLSRTAWLFAALFFLAPTVSYINGFLVPYIGPLESPGWTYIYGVTLAMSLVLVRNPLWSIALFGIYFLFALFLFQRGTFVAFGVAWLFVFLASGWRGRSKLFGTLAVRGVAVAAVGILTAPIAFQLLFGSHQGRFLVTPGNLLRFIYSIVSGNVALEGGGGGTRNHRLEMWTEITRLVFSSVDTAVFGFGFGGEVGDVLGITFRAPHNGFITLLFRGGLIGLLLFVAILVVLFRYFGKVLRTSPEGSERRRHAAMGLILVGAMVGEAMAGTILDSPFTSMLFYTHVAVLLVIVSRMPLERPPVRGIALVGSGAEP